MKIVQQNITQIDELPAALLALSAVSPDWLLVFANIEFLDQPQFFSQIRNALPNTVLLGCSTAGEISKQGVRDNTAVLTAVSWSFGRPSAAVTHLDSMDDSIAAGERLAMALRHIPMSGVLLLGQGVNINGSALVAGLSAQLPANTPIIGGLAGDSGAFKSTRVLSDQGVSSNEIVALALPAGLQVGHGSFGGWKPFGPARRVTRSEGNVLFELDGEAALAVYKRYLGEYAEQLPASGLLFPFEMLGQDHNEMGLVRTILGIDEAAGSLILAGDIEADGYLRLMHASNDALVEGAEAAANAAQAMLMQSEGALAILVSCVGRKLVMGGRIDEEVEAVGDVLGQGATLTGFYSYGEISPFVHSAECKLHNQTMTITLLHDAVHG